MQWTVWLEARTSDGGVTTTELTTVSRSVMDSQFADVGLVLSETKALSTKLQTSKVCDQMAEYARAADLRALRGAAAAQRAADTSVADTVWHGRDCHTPVQALSLPPVRADGKGGLVLAGL